MSGRWGSAGGVSLLALGRGQKIFFFAPVSSRRGVWVRGCRVVLGSGRLGGASSRVFTTSLLGNRRGYLREVSKNILRLGRRAKGTERGEAKQERKEGEKRSSKPRRSVRSRPRPIGLCSPTLSRGQGDELTQNSGPGSAWAPVAPARGDAQRRGEQRDGRGSRGSCLRGRAAGLLLIRGGAGVCGS